MIRMVSSETSAQEIVSMKIGVNASTQTPEDDLDQDNQNAPLNEEGKYLREIKNLNTII
jgi:hypothetical protein